MEILSAILSGGFAGATVAGVLMKILFQNQLERSQRRLQHELDKEMEKHRAQLELLTAKQKIRPVSYVQKNIEALEAAYSAVVKTALPHHKFRRSPTTRNFSGSVEEQETGKYFHLFSENFKAFSKAFDSVSNAFQLLEDKAIYLTPELERKANSTLTNIHDFYHKRHSMLKNGHEIAQRNFDGKIIKRELRSFDFEEFNLSMRNEWRQVTAGIRNELKDQVRNKLLSKDA